jgi:NADH-ubiquinone oxidoreductase chain 6
MSAIYVIYESFTNMFNSSILNIISLAAILCGIFVIISKNPILSVLFLIGLFLSMSAYLMMLGINFIGLSYLLVYVGAVSILFLFILMLINIRISELVTDNSNSVPLAIIIGILFNVTLYDTLPLNGMVNNHTDIISFPLYLLNSLNTYNFSDNLKNIFSFSNLEHIEDVKALSFVSSQAWDINLAETSHITAIGNVLYTVYPIWLIITSMILLLAMVGAIVITIKPRENNPAEAEVDADVDA